MLARAAAISAALMLAACKTFSPDGGLSVAAAVAEQDLHKDTVAIRNEDDAAAVRARVHQLTGKTLTADAAVQIALLNNRGLQAAYNALGIAEAVSVQQSLPPNPSATISRVSGSVETEIDRQVVGSILALATLPARSEIAENRFRQAQLAAAEETLRVATEARRAYYRAVAAREAIGLLEQAESAAATSARLARRLGESGTMNRLDQAREQTFHADIANQLVRARQRAAGERERLTRLLGFAGEAFTLPNGLPALPRRARVMRAVEQDALSRRVDLQIARIELETLAKSYGLTRATRFINVLDAGYADKITKNRNTGEDLRDRGFTVVFEVPLFDFGEARVREAEQTYLQAVNRLADKAVTVRSQAREAYGRYRASYDVARRYQNDILPARKTISEEMMLRYGAMQVDVFSLLSDARQRIAAGIAAVEARRDFWVASVGLSAAISGGTAEGGEMQSAATPTANGDAVSH